MDPNTLEYSALSLLDLSEDCLLHIFQYFDVHELINIENVCQTFQEITNQRYKQQRTFTIEYRTLEPARTVSILQRIGKSLKKFSFSGGYMMNDKIKMLIIESLSLYCDNLKYLQLNYVELRDYHTDLLKKVAENIETLDLGQCKLNDDIEEFLLCLPQLKHLVIKGNSMVSGKCLLQLKTLQSLDVSYCFHLDYIYFSKFLKAYPDTLKSLNVSGSVLLLEGKLVEDILYFQKNLECLFMEYLGIQHDVSLFKTLKQLKKISIMGRKFGT
jgi:hypothetical protein